jgi:hypothetical protein
VDLGLGDVVDLGVPTLPARSARAVELLAKKIARAAGAAMAVSNWTW